MRKITTRLISAALAAGMMLSILPVSVFAAGIDTGGGKHSSPDTVSAQTLDMQNDAEGTGTEDDPYIIHTDANGAPTGTSDKWATSNAGFSAIVLKSAGYYSFPDSSVTQPVTYTIMNSDTPLDADTARNVTIVDGVFAAPNWATLLMGNQPSGVIPTIAGGLYINQANLCESASITGGVFDKKTNNMVVSYSSKKARTLTATDCTIDTLIKEAAYVVGQQSVTVNYTGSADDLGGWDITVGGVKKSLYQLTGTIMPENSTTITFTMPGDADVTLTPLLSAELKIAADGYP